MPPSGLGRAWRHPREPWFVVSLAGREMPATVSLKEIVDALGMQFDESAAYWGRETGEVYHLSREILDMAEQEESPEALPDWQQEEYEAASLLSETDRLIPLPTKWDVHEWEIMREFASAQEAGAPRPTALDGTRPRGLSLLQRPGAAPRHPGAVVRVPRSGAQGDRDQLVSGARPEVFGPSTLLFLTSPPAPLAFLSGLRRSPTR